MSIELKIKSKHLALEAQVIRFEEHKLRNRINYAIKKNVQVDIDSIKYTWHSINEHRRWDVRNENRATFLARAYLAGLDYKTVEVKRKPENEYKFVAHIIPRVLAMVIKYGNGKNSALTRDDIKEWAKL